MKKIIIFPLLILMTMWVALQASTDERKLAVRRLAEEAASGNPEAMFHLARLHETGYDSIAVDSVRATILYRIAAEKGNAKAQNYIGFRYYTGEAVNRNIDSAIYWISKAADAGDLSAANNLGYLYAEGEGVRKDYGKAIAWLSKAAEAGVPAAEIRLADMLKEGTGTPPDTLNAERLYRSAISHRLYDAELKLIPMMTEKWETLSPDSGVMLGKDYHKLGAHRVGAVLFKIAAGKGNRDGLALMGDAYSRGDGVRYDHDKGMKYYLEAAMLGHPSAQFIIAELLEMFPDALKGIESDEISQLEAGISADELNSPSFWYTRAAESGVKNAVEAETRLWQ